MKLNDGQIIPRTKGTPQGSIIGPVLANLFLHYVFDVWMKKHYPDNLWCRYADDGLVHCRNEKEALFLMEILKKRFIECGLELHPDKTKIIYCKDGTRKESHSNINFDFLGFTFRPRGAKNKMGIYFTSFLPAISKKALKGINAKTKSMNFRNRTDLELRDISKMYNPVLRGLYNYYGKFYSSAMNPIWKHFNKTLTSWAMKKYKKFTGRKVYTTKFIERIMLKDPKLFIHWEKRI